MEIKNRKKQDFICRSNNNKILLLPITYFSYLYYFTIFLVFYNRGYRLMPKIKFTPFLPTETKNIIDRNKQLNEQHIRRTRSMIYSNAYRKLSGNEIRLFDCMKLKFHEEERKNDDFAFSKSMGVKVLGLSNNSEKTIRRALVNLVKYGFIEQTFISKGGGKNTKQSNRYKFSTRWREL